MARGHFLLSCIAMLTTAMMLIPPTSGGYGDCSITMYRRILAQPQAIVTHAVVSGRQSYRCGRFNWRRCRRTVYRRETVTRYVARYQSESYVTQMCCTGFVGSPPNCAPMTCPTLSAPSGGRVHVGNREYQSVATYSCNCSSQYRLVGQQTQTCQSNSRWSGSAPTCQRLHCPLLSNISNGLVSLNNSAYVGSNATYTCSEGYELIGVSYRVCQHTETWSGSTPTCSRITCPTINDLSNDHMTVSVGSNNVDGIANYTCATGYQLIGSSRRTCLVSGQWNGVDPFCQRVTCPRLSSPSGGIVHVGNREYQSVATYTCFSQYKRIGYQTQTCQYHRRWSGSAPTCQRLRCPSLSNISNGLVLLSNPAYVRSNATYTCSEGYELIGVSYRVCQHTETWSGSIPTCSPVTCPRLSAPSRGRVYVGDPVYRTVATYSCSEQYRLVGNRTQTCQSNGQWNGSAPTCRHLRCPSLSNIPNGHVWMINRGYVRSGAIYMCFSGYKVVGIRYHVCQYTETWSGSTPTCSRITCPTINDLSNDHMTVSVSSYYIDGIANYTCATGYQLIGSSRRTCWTSGQWNGVEPSCQRMTCPRLSAPSDGSVYVGNREYQSVAMYTCSSQYELVGQQIRTCLSNREWSGSAPTCQRLRCPLLSNITSGHVSLNIPAYVGSNATYTCSWGYKLVGVCYRVCQHTETWSGSTPTCSRITCPTIDDLNNDHMTVSVSSYYVDGIANYTCASDYQLIGSSRHTCLVSGRWDGVKPSCQRMCVPTFGFAHPFLRIMEGETVSVCIKNCSCTVEQNFTVELVATSPIEGEDVSNDLIIPARVELGDHSMCFSVTAVDDDLLEGYQSLSILLYKPPEEPYEICPNEDVFPILIVDNDELTIGFENVTISVGEGVRQVEARVVVFEPNSMIPIPDVVLEINTFHFGSARNGMDFTSFANYPISFSESIRHVSFNIDILDDDIIENDEKFSIILKRSSSIPTRVPLIIEPEMMTVNILDDDGVCLGFERSIIEKDEGGSNVNVEVCIVSRFSDTDVDDFSLTVQSSSLLAAEGEDYESINFNIGPFSHSSSRHCFDVVIIGDRNFEPDESFTITIRGEPANVMVEPRIMLVTIRNDDEQQPSCDNPLRFLLPNLFEHCSTHCTFTYEWSEWKEVANSSVEVPLEKCPSKEMGVKVRQKNATTMNCEPKLEKKERCILSKGESFLGGLGVGTNGGVGISSTTLPDITVTTSDSRRKRSTSQNQSHCYEPENTLFLQPDQCRPSQSCQYAQYQPQSRDLLERCDKRSVLFVVDSSGSIGEMLFREIADSLSYLVKNLCGDIQFGLLKFSSGAYLEFCFNCYSNDQRDELQSRIRSTEYIGRTSFTGYATKCVNNFMFNSSCGQHEDRCIDIVYVTDGNSIDSAYFNVCDEIECIHKNPKISNKLRVHAVGVGRNMGNENELECITKYSKLQNNEPPIFNFEDRDELIVELNTVIRAIELDQHRFRASGEKPKYQCTDWIDGGKFEYGDTV